MTGSQTAAHTHRTVHRTAVILFLTLAATVTGTVGLFSASAQVSAPSARSLAASSSALPVCPPGQEATTLAGSGTPASLGNLQNVPAGIAGGGTFAGVALDAEQVKMAATVAAVGKQMGITRRGIEIGIAVATEQSSLRPDAVNEAWLGLFQQNPVDYTMYPRTEPGGAAWMFYDRLLKLVPGYDTDPRTDHQIGDVVQLTGTGERFGQYQDMARDLAGQLIESVSLAQDDVTCVPAPASPATTAGSGFDPGNIISDAVFYNTGAMTAEQIRQFVLTQGEGCTGAYCLKNLRVSTSSQPADRYCAAYRGGANEDVAAVLLRVSVACGINPQVMLVTLQKESALLSRTDVSASTYNAAWGWHCPDTGPGGSANCDPAYAGFFNQAYGMAKQWSRYKLDPDKYNYHAGQTVNILWNVAESGCGSAPVTIANQATASLYIYTPYQPNQASLAAYPGVGDACSSYGNRNFFYLFRKYFGSTGGGTSTTATSAVLATGTAVKIPANQFVSAALGGQMITAPTAAVAAGLAAGFSALGLPYVWGGGGSGAGPNNGCARGGGEYNSCGATIGFDCSGLTAFVLGKAGFRIPDNSGSQRSAGVTVSWSQALPGDVVGFPGHVAIYLGTFGARPYILEASWVGTPIHIVPLTRTDVDDRLYRYWTGPAAGAPGVADFSSLIQGLQVSASGSHGGSSSGSSGVPWVSLTPRGSSGTPARSAPANPLSYGSVTWVPQIVPRPVPAPVAAPPVIAEPPPATEPSEATAAPPTPSTPATPTTPEPTMTTPSTTTTTMTAPSTTTTTPAPSTTTTTPAPSTTTTTPAPSTTVALTSTPAPSTTVALTSTPAPSTTVALTTAPAPATTSQPTPTPTTPIPTTATTAPPAPTTTTDTSPSPVSARAITAATTTTGAASTTPPGPSTGSSALATPPPDPATSAP